MDSVSSANFFSFEQDDLLIKSMPILQELRKDEVFCDIVVKVGDQEFPAHRIILAATIPYFRTMLTSDYIESKQKEVVIKDIKPAILEVLIEFSYSGKIKSDHENVQELMQAADFFQLNQVKNECANFLKTNIKANNVFEIVMLADLLDCHELAVAADKFIKGKFHEIVGSIGFLLLEFEKLKELIGKDGLICSEKNVFEAAMNWVKYNEDERSSLLPEILSTVRLSLVSTEYLVNVVSKEKLIESSNDCIRIVDKAKNYHLMQCESKLTQRSRDLPKSSDLVPTIYGGKLKFYDAMQNKWLKEEPMDGDRTYSAIASLRSKIYVIGGEDNSKHNVDIFNLETKKWSKGKNMVNGRSSFGATTMDDNIYVCGGYKRGNGVSNVDCYSIKENSWKELSQMKTERYDLVATSLNGYIYAIGGMSSTTSSFCEKYDPKSNTWTDFKSLLVKRYLPGVATLNNIIYVCGGNDHNAFLNSCEVYDPSSDTWSFIAPMNEKRHQFSLASFNGKLYAVGGKNGFNGNSYLSSVEVYTPETNSWEILNTV